MKIKNKPITVLLQFYGDSAVYIKSEAANWLNI